MDFSRTDRISSSIQKALAQIIRDEVKDPRVGLVTIQEVRTVRDLSQAKVYFTLMDETQAKDVEKALNKAAGFIRHQLRRHVQLRSLPQLVFVYDTSIVYGNRLQQIIEDTVREDSQKQQDDKD